MFGVLVNVGTVLLGSAVGLLFKKGIPEKVSNAAMIGLGVCTLYIGISGSLCGENVLIVIAAMVLGAIAGTALDIDGKLAALGQKVEQKFQKAGKGHSILITKAMLDLVSSMMLASSLGLGVMLSAGSVLLIQGGLVLLSGLIAPLLSVGAINEMTCTGSLLIILIGTNLMGLSKFKVADYLPAILLAPIIYNIVQLL